VKRMERQHFTEKVTLITTVKNEESTIRAFLDSVLVQSRPPDEVIITDGGSTDRTVEIITEYIRNARQITLVEVPGNRSKGRNEAIGRAANDIIACSDGGCVLDPDWLKHLMEVFENNPNIDVVAGFYMPIAVGAFGKCVGALTVRDARKIDPSSFLPSARSVAFKRDAWAEVGGFPEEFSHNEDTPFMLALRRAGRRFAFAPDAIVYWQVSERPRSLFRQYYRYAMGDAEARLVIKYRSLFVRYFAGIALLGLALFYPFLWVVVVGLVVSYLIIYAIRAWKKTRLLCAFILGPLVKGILDCAALTGFVRGIMFSKQRGAPLEQNHLEC